MGHSGLLSFLSTSQSSLLALSCPFGFLLERERLLLQPKWLVQIFLSNSPIRYFTPSPQGAEREEPEQPECHTYRCPPTHSRKHKKWGRSVPPLLWAQKTNSGWRMLCLNCSLCENEPGRCECKHTWSQHWTAGPQLPLPHTSSFLLKLCDI